MTNKLSRLSTAMIWMCNITIILLPAALISIWIFSDDRFVYFDSFRFLDNTDLSLISNTQLFLATAIGALGLSIVIYALWQLRYYFIAYKAGDYFSPATTVHLHRFSTALLTMAIFNLLQSSFFSLVLTWHNPPGQRALVLNLGSQDLFLLIITGVMFCVSWSLQQAYTIQQENREFI